ncbi:MAG: hypothetical protein JJU34_02075 [Lunatimonas sp.]|uniref:hypothetical protein n=1 Tax=Lunatimonas sp. TaxID=2060141 RepID=UPI00263BE12C|nr:hypothetical protein [Lunatimonas sp.]MCC5936046.1 hypothetical protein [Lunatimonas sp.]
MTDTPTPPVFGMPLRGILLLAGVYTFIWGAFFKWFGPTVLGWMASESVLNSIASTNAFGTFGMLIGFLIFLSAFYPFSWVYLIGLGIVGKLVSLAWFVLAYSDVVTWNKRSFFYLIANDLIWIIPLAIIGYKALQGRRYLATLEK